MRASFKELDAAGLEQALKPFGQADSGLNRKYEGTGLGVPLAKALTELQGGRFAIASKSGAGTRVTITMPLVQEPVREIAVAAVPRRGRIRVRSTRVGSTPSAGTTWVVSA